MAGTANAYGALSSGFTRDQILTAIQNRTIYNRQSAEDTQTLDLTGITMLCNEATGNLYAYDSADASTAHDAITCFVDANGRRYKIVDEIRWPYAVLDRLGTPPGAPTVGDTYLITTGTGAWAGQDDYITRYAAAGWAFIAPRVGAVLYVEDETAFYHYTAGGAWSAGLGSLSLAADAVTPIENQFWGGVSVEDILNTPPGSPTDGQAYLVDTSPTGDFAGHAGKIAYRRSGAWEFESPYEGAAVYDKDTNAVYRYESSAWATTTVAAKVVIGAGDVGIYDWGVSGHSTAIDFTGLSEYIALKLILNSVGGTFTNATVSLRTSTDDGSSFAASANNYTLNSDETVTKIDIATAASGSTNIIKSVFIDLWNDGDQESFFTISDGNMGERNAEEANNALRIVVTTDAGTLTSGRAILIGYRA